MKRSLITVAACSAALLSSGYLLAQNKDKAKAKAAPPPAAAAAPAQPAPKQQRLVRVATLNDTQANREFQANVQLVQAQRQAALQLNDEIQKEKDAKKKEELKKQLDQVMAKLNENNQAMVKAYGFSIERNYTLEIEKAHVYMFVTDEEAAKIEKAEAEKAKAPAKK